LGSACHLAETLASIVNGVHKAISKAFIFLPASGLFEK
jgi:hypothetical protein